MSHVTGDGSSNLINNYAKHYLSEEISKNKLNSNSSSLTTKVAHKIFGSHTALLQIGSSESQELKGQSRSLFRRNVIPLSLQIESKGSVKTKTVYFKINDLSQALGVEKSKVKSFIKENKQSIKLKNADATHFEKNVGKNLSVAALMQAIEKGDEKAVENMIHRGCTTNTKDLHQANPLYQAVKTGNQAIAALLLKNHAAIGFSEDPEFCPLIQAIKEDNPQMLHLLLSTAKKRYTDGEDESGEEQILMHNLMRTLKKDTTLTAKTPLVIKTFNETGFASSSTLKDLANAALKEALDRNDQELARQLREEGAV